MTENIIKKNEDAKVEKSGATSSNRFDYQYACAFYVLLTRYTECENFYIILEYLDDFVIVDNEGDENEKIIYVQVKTEEAGPINGTDEKFKEHIGKLAAHFDGYKDECTSAILLTNNGVKFKNYLASSEDNFAFLDSNDVSNVVDIDEFKNSIKNKLEEKGVTFNEENFSKIYLKKSPLSISSNKSENSLTYKTQLKGILHDYVTAKDIGDLSCDAVETIYTTLWEDICRKSKCVYNKTDIKDKEFLLKNKIITYEYFIELLNETKIIQIPENKEMANFYRANKDSLELGGLSEYEFNELYKKFKSAAPKVEFKVLEIALSYIEENRKSILDLTSTEERSKEIDKLLSNYELINTNEFYKTYRYCISTLFTYRFDKWEI